MAPYFSPRILGPYDMMVNNQALKFLQLSVNETIEFVIELKPYLKLIPTLLGSILTSMPSANLNQTRVRQTLGAFE
jgi:hypothetical protein